MANYKITLEEFLKPIMDELERKPVQGNLKMLMDRIKSRRPNGQGIQRVPGRVQKIPG